MSVLRASVWAPAIGLLAIILLTVPLLDIEASAHGMGGGARGIGGKGGSFGRGIGGGSFIIPTIMLTNVLLCCSIQRTEDKGQ